MNKNLHDKRKSPAPGTELNYLALHSRPYIMFSVSLLSRFNGNPGVLHWKGAKRNLRYLKGTIEHGLVLEPKILNLVGFSDADWGSQVDDRKSSASSNSSKCIWN